MIRDTGGSGGSACATACRISVSTSCSRTRAATSGSALTTAWPSSTANDFTVQALGRPQGVAMRTFWTDSGIVTSQGEILFGANGGLTVVRPERMRPWAYRPPVVVTSVQNSADKRGLKVEFAALDYSSPERNRYSYRLVGFDQDWISTDPNVRLANYTNLPPGNYTLELRGSNRDGRWSEPLRMPVNIEAAWYQTSGFKIAAVLLGLLLVALLVQARTVYLRQRQRELQAARQ